MDSKAVRKTHYNAEDIKGSKNGNARIKLSIVMPVYNEEKTLREIVSKIEKVNIRGIEKELIIVEAKSTDNTPYIVDSLAKKNWITAYHLERYCGKGAKVKFGFKMAQGDIILIQDADLEYDPIDYPDLINPIINGKANFVLGSRHLGRRTWKIRKFTGQIWYSILINFSSIVLHRLFAILYGVYLTDPMTMYKVFKRDILKGLKLDSEGFHLDWEIVCKFVKHGHKPLEVPVNYISRGSAEGKKVNVIRDGVLAVWTIIKYRFTD